MRVKITLQYNGAPYLGLQSQTKTENTVIGTLQRALLRLNINEKIVASGRTDKGVHATGQVLHCDLPQHWHNLQKLKRSLNHQLPDSIHIRRIEEAADDFHARYSAKRRVYRYILSAREPNPFEADFITFVDSVDFSALVRAIGSYVGTYDFKYFKKSGSDTENDIRTVYRAIAYRRNKNIVLTFEANGYLRSQIRMMVGFLLLVSQGKRNVGDLKAQLLCEADFKVKPAPCNGLYLAKVKY